MSELERQTRISGYITPNLQGTNKSDDLIVEVACDDRQTQLAVQGNETVGQIRRKALSEMQIKVSDPNKYVVIGPNHQPINNQRTAEEILKEGQALYFRLIPQVAFGIGSSEVHYA